MPLRLSRIVPERRRLPALLVLAVLAIAGGVWFSSYVQREAARRVAEQEHDSESMLTGMLDQETGLRGFLLTRRKVFLEPYVDGRAELDTALRGAYSTSVGDAGMTRLIDGQERVARGWQRLAEQEVARARAHPRRGATVAPARLRKGHMDRFRAINSAFHGAVEKRRAAGLRDAATVAVIVILVLGMAFSGLGRLLIRQARRAREREQEFAETLQVMRSEKEAHALIQGHIERTTGASSATVLTRNNSADRLVASTDLDEDDPILERLEGAAPESCLAVRLSRPHARAHGAEPLLRCAVCGGTPGASLCQPLLVGGEVLGSVLMRKSSQPTAIEVERLAQAVSRAAPALANVRNLAIAEARAQTDALTGLANKRAINDTMRRLHAHSVRTGQTLSVVLADLDHFKKINDTYGHDRGDEVLAAAADALASEVRRSDFVGRMGGEEFIVILPDTKPSAAETVAENLRRAVRGLHVPGVEVGVSASFGVAAFPDDALEIDALLRSADRALYLAKKLGRDRIERGSAVSAPALAALPAAPDRDGMATSAR
jgi:diguanylate cyclase (GGDEF)-like protein